MKTPIKKAIFGMATILCLFIAMSEASSAISLLVWSGSWLIACGLSGNAFSRCLTKEEKEEQV